jgi:hypothetical protein
LIKIPGISSALNGNFGEYVNFLYALAISVAALIAVVKIIVAGMKYMMSEVVTTKGDAKKEITSSLLGLLLILGAYIILYTINPQLTNQTIKFKDLPPDPHINDAPSVTTDGQPVDQVTGGIAAAGGACAKQTITNQAISGGALAHNRWDISTCTDKDATINSMRTACLATQGAAFAPAPDKSWVGCNIPIQGGATAGNYASTIVGTNPLSRIDSQFITQNGTLITTNLAAACDNNVKNLPPNQQKGSYNSCITGALVRLQTACEGDMDNGAFGLYNASNKSAVTCKLPRDKKPISSLTDAFNAWKAADPSRKYDVLDNLSTSNEKVVCEQFAKGKYFDVWGSTNYCVFY